MKKSWLQFYEQMQGGNDFKYSIGTMNAEQLGGVYEGLMDDLKDAQNSKNQSEINKAMMDIQSFERQVANTRPDAIRSLRMQFPQFGSSGISRSNNQPSIQQRQAPSQQGQMPSQRGVTPPQQRQAPSPFDSVKPALPSEKQPSNVGPYGSSKIEPITKSKQLSLEEFNKLAASVKSAGDLYQLSLIVKFGKGA